MEGDVQMAGTERIGGVNTTRVTWKGSLATYLAYPTGARRRSAELFLTRVEGQISVDAWVDDGGLVRQVRINAPLYYDAFVDTTITVRLSQIGVPISIQAPPLEQTAVLPR